MPAISLRPNVLKCHSPRLSYMGFCSAYICDWYIMEIPPLCSVDCPHHISYGMNLGGMGFSGQILWRKLCIWWNLKHSEVRISNCCTQKSEEIGTLEVKKCLIWYNPLSNHHLKALMSWPGIKSGLLKMWARGRQHEVSTGSSLNLSQRVKDWERIGERIGGVL